MKVAAAIFLMLAATGCAARPAPGKATLRVSVRAEPKEGAKPFRKFVSTSDRVSSEASQTAGEFTLVNYATLDDIVVWVQPANSSATTARSIEVDVPILRGSSTPPLFAASVGQPVKFFNAGPGPLRLYSVSDGNEFDLGVLALGERKAQATQSPGLVEVLDGDTYAVLARIYVTPGIAARVVKSGTDAQFVNMAPGRWRVAAWHERLPGSERNVTLAPGHVRDVELVIGVNALPKVR